jgi:hypothetical protein
MTKPTITEEVRANLAASIATFQENHEHLIKGLEKAMQAFREAVQKEPESLRNLADLGWYLPYEFNGPLLQLTEGTRLIKMIDEGKSHAVDQELIGYFDNNIIEIQRKLIELYPTRASQIQSAINAHLRGDYYASIPIFFCMIEGICQQITGYRFFKVESTKKWALKFKDASILSIILEPLKHESTVRRKQERGMPSGLNRHDVLHGTCVDYGDNALNSYKALSLLNYVAVTVNENVKHE